MTLKNLSAFIKGLFLGLSSALVVISVMAQVSSLPQQTIINLNKAFEGESNANYKYGLFAQRAEEEQQKEIAKMFRAIAFSESIHMYNHKKVLTALNSPPAEVKLNPVTINSTKENLKGPIKGETYENDSMYPDFIKQSQEDNNQDAVRTFLYARRAEKQHEVLFKKALRNFGKNKPEDYCVSTITGAVYTVKPGAICPLGSNGKTEEYTKIE